MSEIYLQARETANIVCLAIEITCHNAVCYNLSCQAHSMLVETAASEIATFSASVAYMLKLLHLAIEKGLETAIFGWI